MKSAKTLVGHRGKFQRRWVAIGAIALVAGAVVSCDPLRPLTNINETPIPANIRLSNGNLIFTALSDTQMVDVRVVTASGDTVSDVAINLSLDGASVEVTTLRTGPGASALRIVSVANGAATIHVNAGTVSRALTAAVDQAVSTLALSDTTLSFSTVGQSARIDVQPLDARGNTVAALPVQWSSEEPQIVTVDSSGVFTSVRSGSTTAVASAGGMSGRVRVTVQQTVERLVLTDGDGQLAPVATAVPVAPSVTLLDSEGNPVPDMLVSFTTASGGGSVVPSSAVLTDANGVAAVESWTLGPTMGVNRLIATAVTRPNATVTITATGTAGEATTIRAQAGNNQSAVAGSTVAVPAAVIVTDAFGNGVGGQSVTFSPVPGSGMSLPSEPILTNASGIATIASWTLGNGTGLQFLIATAGNDRITGSPVTFLATATTGVAASIAIQSGDGQSAVAGQTVAVTPTVLVTDALGNPVANVQINFSVTLGGGSIQPTTSVTTNGSGIAALQSWTLGDNLGPNVLTASAVGLPDAEVVFTAQATAGPPATLRADGSTEQTTNAGSAVPIAPAVRLTDASGHPVHNASITFSVLRGGGTLQPSTPVLTDANGMASLASWTLGTAAGTNEVRATTNGVQGEVLFTALGTAGPPVAIAINGGNNQTAVVGTNVAVAPSAKITDQFGNPVSGIPVSFRITSGGGSIVPTTSVATGANGVAQLNRWTLGTQTGANTLVASAVGVPNSPTFTATGTSGVAAAIQLVSGDNQTAVVGAAVPVPPSVKVTDVNGNAVANVPVVFALTGGNGTVQPSSPVMSDGNGIARVVSWTLGLAAGTNTLNASATGVPGSVTFTATGTPGPPGRISIMTQPSNTAASGVPLATQPVVEIQDDAGNTIAQAGVPITAIIASGGGTLTGTGTINTNAQGSAPFTDLTISGTVGARTISFVSAGYVTPQSNTIQVNAGPADRMVIASGNNQTARAGTAVAESPAALVTDASGNPVANISVTFSVGAGGGTVNPATPIATNSNGLATVTSWTLGTGIGAQSLTAAAAGIGGTLTFEATSTSGPASVVAINAGNGQTAQVGTAVAIAPSVRVADTYGNPVSGAVVNFAITGGGGTAQPTTAIATNASGIAGLSSWKLGTAAGVNTLQAAAVGVAQGVTFQATAQVGVPSAIAVNGGNGQTAIAGAAVAVPPSAKVTDQFGNPIAGVPVVFTVASGGGTVAPTNSILTNVNGVATLTTWTLGVVAGPNAVTASATGLASTASFTATATAGPAAVLTIAGGNAQTATVGTAVPVAPSVRVADANNNSVAGASVTFAVSAGNGTIEPTNAVATNGSGIASLNSWILGSTPGSNSLTVSAAGVAGSVTFNATANTGAPTTLTVNGGQNQTAPAGTAVPVVPSVLVQDALGNPVANVAVAFSISAGGGVIVPTTNIPTGADGIAAVTSWTLGPNTGANTLTATATAIAGASVVFTATATARPPITLEQTVSASADKAPYTLPAINGGTNQTYVLFVTTEDNKDVTGVSGGGLTWIERKEQCTGEDKSGIRVWTAQGSPSSFQATATVSSGKDAALILSRYSGVTTIEGAAGNNEGGGGCGKNDKTDSATLTLTSNANGSVHVLGLALENEKVSSFSSGYTQVGAITNDDALMRVYKREFSSGATDTFTASLDKKDRWATAGIVLKQ